MSTLGKQLKTIRKQSGLTLETVSKKTGINYTILSRIEKDERKPTDEQIEKLSKLYGVSKNLVRTEIISNKIVELLKLEENTDEILFEVKLKLGEMMRVNKTEKKNSRPYMGEIGEVFFIRSSGIGEFKRTI